MIHIEVHGLQAARDRLETLYNRSASTAFWQQYLREEMEDALEYARLISPVVTGSYQGSHRVAISGMQATLSVDPTARNVKSNVLVTRYAPSVEARHQVYKRTAAHLDRISGKGAAALARKLVE